MCLPRPDAPRVAKMIASAWRPPTIPVRKLTGATPISTASPPALAACGIGTLINAVSGPASYGELDYAQQAAAQPGHTAPTV
jgi:hypothetical protein